MFETYKDKDNSPDYLPDQDTLKELEQDKAKRSLTWWQILIIILLSGFVLILIYILFFIDTNNLPKSPPTGNIKITPATTSDKITLPYVGPYAGMTREEMISQAIKAFDKRLTPAPTPTEIIIHFKNNFADPNEKKKNKPEVDPLTDLMNFIKEYDQNK